MICTKTQGFGENGNPSYKAQGLKGHTGIDVKCEFDSPVEFPIVDFDRAYVSLVLDKEHPAADGSNYWCVNAIVERANGEVFEFQIGHLNKIFVRPGLMLTPGYVIGTEGNHGIVYEGHRIISIAEENIGIQDGHHRHYQKRLLNKVSQAIQGKNYISGWKQVLYVTPGDERFLEVINYDNGFHGCVDPQGELDRYEAHKATLPGYIAPVGPTVPVSLHEPDLNREPTADELNWFQYVVYLIKQWASKRKV